MDMNCEAEGGWKTGSEASSRGCLNMLAGRSSLSWMRGVVEYPAAHSAGGLVVLQAHRKLERHTLCVNGGQLDARFSMGTDGHL